MQERSNTAIWSEKRQRWEIVVKRNGKRKQFYSSKPGRTGQRECNKKADIWLSGTSNLTVTCAELYEEWAQELKDTTSEGNWRQLISNMRNWILPVIGSKKASALTVQHCKDVLRRAYVAGKSEKTLRNIRFCLLSFLRFARDSNATTLNPDTLRIPRDSPKTKRTTLQPDDIKILFSSEETTYNNKTEADWYIHAYRFAVATGVRPGELIALKVRDIRNGRTYISSSIDFYGNVTQGKTENAQRTFVNNPIVQKIIADQKAMLKKAGIVSVYLFPTQEGDAVTQRALWEAWKRYIRHNNITDISLYELRHTFVSINKSLPEGLKRMIVGHSEDMDTEGVYSHKIAGDDELAAALVEENLSRYINPKV